ncbi:Hsp20/alpha crystallin family protein [Halorubellus sp. PRR65]|uniref:Hsp20/alpha crystallin family protein n=1 Tax=Halorubellus sp. PRR65 TaxID=3098148 RepID=UPI002B2579F8|nr:Hsp20/alpha crystallin family protein [Halorubellus sp. PRR65]
MNLGEVSRSVGNRVLETVGRAASRVQERRPLPADVLESDDAYLVVFDAPGVAQTDVQVRYVDGAVEVQIDRFREFYDDHEMRVPGRGMSLDGRADLPADALVDADASSATLRANGTLEVRVPKREPESGERDASAGTVEIATPDDDENGADEANDAEADDDAAAGTDAEADEE